MDKSDWITIAIIAFIVFTFLFLYVFFYFASNDYVCHRNGGVMLESECKIIN